MIFSDWRIANYVLYYTMASTLLLIFYYADIDCISKKITNINGVTIPEGAVVIIPSAMIHRSPLYWKDPDNFDPDRLIIIGCIHAIQT